MCIRDSVWSFLNKADEGVVAESESIEETVTDGVVVWRNGFSLGSVETEELRIEFSMNGAKLYSFGFDLRR